MKLGAVELFAMSLLFAIVPLLLVLLTDVVFDLGWLGKLALVSLCWMVVTALPVS
ncbi:MAG: hypothetical protein ACI855_005390, partial [Myxococcota bacterium]